MPKPILYQHCGLHRIFLVIELIWYFCLWKNIFKCLINLILEVWLSLILILICNKLCNIMFWSTTIRLGKLSTKDFKRVKINAHTLGQWCNNCLHYYQSEVQFISLNHYGTLKSEINSLHFNDFTLVKVISL
jgi:hypothetical protein